MKSKYQMGLCDKCDGNIQFDKINQQYYCMDCMKTWNEDEWNTLVDLTREEDYKEHTADENLSYLNSL